VSERPRYEIIATLKISVFSLKIQLCELPDARHDISRQARLFGNNNDHFTYVCL
jgi:hypothetical protein